MTLRRLPRCFALLASFALMPHFASADQWTAATAEELSMTSAPQAPGARAIYLFREKVTEDKLHMFSVSVRIKVLTEAGKDLGNVDLGYFNGGNARMSLDELAGRTIHPDGTVIPFTGKPYDKLIEKQGNGKVMAKVFSLPDVTVGSILEYRYKIRYDDHYYVSPDWYIQDELFTRKVHFLWRPTSAELVSSDERGQLTSTIAWTPILPAGITVHQERNATGQLTLELTANDIPPMPHEEHMPPVNSFSYRVLFYYSPYRGYDEFWKNEGKYWAKKRDKFIGPGPGVKAAVAELVQTSDTPEVKLRKLYPATQRLENTDLTRSRSTSEDRAEGLGEVHTTDDILRRRRGGGDQIAAVFVAMARAAGMKAYLMGVTNRERSIFFPPYLSTSQLQDDIAIVNYDGKDHFFDPGTQFCAFGHLAWQHARTSGVRQVDGGSVIAQTPSESYTAASVQRIADLTMDEHGLVKGTVALTFTGTPGIRWRQLSVTADEAAVRHDLTEHAQSLLPGGLQLKLTSLTPLDDYEHPLVAKFEASGSIGSGAGKRLLVPGVLFETNGKAVFANPKRELAIDFDYGTQVQDAVRIKFPSNLAVESLPTPAKNTFQGFVGFNLSVTPGKDSVTLRRDYALSEFLYKATEYNDLRAFFQTLEAADQQSIVLKQNPAATEKSAGGAGAN